MKKHVCIPNEHGLACKICKRLMKRKNPFAGMKWPERSSNSPTLDEYYRYPIMPMPGPPREPFINADLAQIVAAMHRIRARPSPITASELAKVRWREIEQPTQCSPEVHSKLQETGDLLQRLRR